MTRKRQSRSENVVAQARGRKSKDAGPAAPMPRRVWDNVKSLLGAILIYLFIKTFFVEAFRIPSGSMIPTLLVADWLFVNKLVYGPHIPFTNINLPGYAEPRRGEVVVFKSPHQPDLAAMGEDPTPTLVKRLVGMPGDTLYMREGLLYVNGEPQRQGYAPVNPRAAEIGNTTDPLMAWQQRIALDSTRFGAPPAVPTVDHWGPLLIPQGTYFMMGDNRYESKDSRFWGVVPRENVRGRPMFIYYSFVPAGESDRPLSFITDIRWSRIGDRIR